MSDRFGLSTDPGRVELRIVADATSGPLEPRNCLTTDETIGARDDATNLASILSTRDKPRTITATFTGTIAAKTALYVVSTGKLGAASSTDGTKIPIGMSVAGGASDSTGNIVYTSGPVAGAIVGATPGTRYWLHTDGTLTTVKPVTSGHALISMGHALSATALFLQIQDLGLVA